MTASREITLSFPNTKDVIKVNKDVLYESSVVFRAILDNNFLEDDEVEISGFELGTMNLLLRHVSDASEIIIAELDDAIKLYLAAHYFVISTVEDNIKEFILSKLNQCTLLKLLSHGMKQDIIFLVDACEDYFRQDTYSVMNEIVVRPHPITDELISHLLSLEPLNVLHEFELYQFLEILVFQKRLKTYEFSLKQIRFTAMNDKQLLSVKILDVQNHLKAILAHDELNCFEDEAIRLLQGGFRGQLFLPDDREVYLSNENIILDEATMIENCEKQNLRSQQLEHWITMVQAKTDFITIYERLVYVMEIVNEWEAKIIDHMIISTKQFRCIPIEDELFLKLDHRQRALFEYMFFRKSLKLSDNWYILQDSPLAKGYFERVL